MSRDYRMLTKLKSMNNVMRLANLIAIGRVFSKSGAKPPSSMHSFISYACVDRFLVGIRWASPWLIKQILSLLGSLSKGRLSLSDLPFLGSFLEKHEFSLGEYYSLGEDVEATMKIEIPRHPSNLGLLGVLLHLFSRYHSGLKRGVEDSSQREEQEEVATSFLKLESNSRRLANV
ncbi:hypothetical protein CR513_03236, partial [Mucuna pruriens]